MLSQMSSSMSAPSAHITTEYPSEEFSFNISALTNGKPTDITVISPSLDHLALASYYATKKLPDLPSGPPRSAKRSLKRNKNTTKRTKPTNPVSHQISCQNIEKKKKALGQGHLRSRHSPVRESESPMDELRKSCDILSEPQLPQNDLKGRHESLHEAHISQVSRPQTLLTKWILLGWR
ncbi:hypothetical protein ACMFMG_003206 [Clarireedia jacksonii]